MLAAAAKGANFTQHSLQQQLSQKVLTSDSTICNSCTQPNALALVAFKVAAP